MVTTLRQRIRSLDPHTVDLLLAVGLALLVCLQIWLVGHIREPRTAIPPGVHDFRPRVDMGVFPYLIAASAFLPLAMRRSVPWLALVLSGVAATLYQVLPVAPAFTILGPMIALYSLAVHANRRLTALLALALTALVGAVMAFAFSFGVRWVAELVGSLMLLSAAAFLGDAARNRRQYIAEVEARAIEAERSREEEALRRVEEERMLIAREVHDIVAHSLSIVTVQAAAAEATLRKDPEQALESIRNIRVTGREALGELRSMLDVLRTGDSGMPLAPSADLGNLGQLIGPVRDAGLQVTSEVEGELLAVPAYASVSAYRIVQEALTNAVRHAKASAVRVSVRVGARALEIAVSDDGIGLSEAAVSSGGHGIQGMRERVEALGGSFALTEGVGGGTLVTAIIPLTRTGS